MRSIKEEVEALAKAWGITREDQPVHVPEPEPVDGD